MATPKNLLTAEETAELTAVQARANEKRRLAKAAAANENAPPPARPSATRRSRPADMPVLVGGLFQAPDLPLRTWTCKTCGGGYENYFDLVTCPTCEQRILETANEQRRQKIRDEVLGPAGADFAGVTIGHPKIPVWCGPSREVARARAAASLAYDEEAKRWAMMLLLGETGSGKTTLASAIFRSRLDRALGEGEAGERKASRMVWVAAVDIAKARRESPLGVEPDLLRRARHAPVLLIDDLGQELPAKDDIVALIMERQKNRTPTLVTCGFSTEDIKARYGDFFERRLTERAHVVRLERKARP